MESFLCPPRVPTFCLLCREMSSWVSPWGCYVGEDLAGTQRPWIPVTLLLEPQFPHLGDVAILPACQ